MNEFKRIPLFRNYAIDKTGKVINFNSLRTVKVVNGKVNMTSDNGKRTTRSHFKLIEQVWGKYEK